MNLISLKRAGLWFVIASLFFFILYSAWEFVRAPFVLGHLFVTQIQRGDLGLSANTFGISLLFVMLFFLFVHYVVDVISEVVTYLLGRLVLLGDPLALLCLKSIVGQAKKKDKFWEEVEKVLEEAERSE